jgi:hypothetical protein
LLELLFEEMGHATGTNRSFELTGANFHKFETKLRIGPAESVKQLLLYLGETIQEKPPAPADIRVLTKGFTTTYYNKKQKFCTRNSTNKLFWKSYAHQ